MNSDVRSAAARDAADHAHDRQHGDDTELVVNPASPVDDDGIVRPAGLAEDRQITSDGSGTAVPGLSKTTTTP